jgi:hypothetical protein
MAKNNNASNTFNKYSENFGNAPDTFKKCLKYINGVENFTPGEPYKHYCIKANILNMINDEFRFQTFNEEGLRMQKDPENKFNEYFCSNEHLKKFYMTGT